MPPCAALRARAAPSPLALTVVLSCTSPRSAVRPSLLPLFQATGASTVRSPLLLLSSTLVLTRLLARVSACRVGAAAVPVLPSISPPMTRPRDLAGVDGFSALATITSFERIFQVPVVPLSARVSTCAWWCTSTLAPRLSTTPPLPWPPRALAS
ncbi:hypothetical protein D3C80_975900 [compost metagenome]